MKITKSYLKEVIKQELQKLQEGNIPMYDRDGEYSGRSDTDFSQDYEDVPRLQHEPVKLTPTSPSTKFIRNLQTDPNREQTAVEIFKMAGIEPLAQGRNFGYLMMPMIMNKPEIQKAVSTLINKQ